MWKYLAWTAEWAINSSLSQCEVLNRASTTTLNHLKQPPPLLSSSRINPWNKAWQYQMQDIEILRFIFPCILTMSPAQDARKYEKKKALQLLQVPGVVAPRCWMTTTSGLNIPSNGSVWENNLKGYSVQDRKHLGIPAVCTQGPIGWHFNPIETQLQTKDTHRAAFDILLFASSHPYTSHADSKSLLRTFFGRQSTSLL